MLQYFVFYHALHQISLLLVSSNDGFSVLVRQVFCILIQHFVLVCFNINYISQMNICEIILFFADKTLDIVLV